MAGGEMIGYYLLGCVVFFLLFFCILFALFLTDHRLVILGANCYLYMDYTCLGWWRDVGGWVGN